MRFLLTGGSGQLGWELRRALAALGEVISPARAELDLAHPELVAARVREIAPQVVVNAAAYTDVERAERETALAAAVNEASPGVLAQEARRLGAQLVHFSTDYVFDGRKRAPYTEEDEPRPLNAYGTSKLAGERAVLAAGEHVLLFRTSWLYSARGRNFLLAILRKARQGEPLAVVTDQVGTPTWARLVADTVAGILGRTIAKNERRRGLYHLAASGAASWHEFAEAIVAAARLPVEVKPIASSAYPSAVARPAFSQLDCGKLARDFGMTLPPWRSGVAACVAELEALAAG